jgi:hypothetical protein
MKNLVKHFLIVFVICFCSCSEIGPNSNEFVVYKMHKYNAYNYTYRLKPTKGKGKLFINTSDIFKVGDTLKLSVNCK